MTIESGYRDDLAYIHDSAYGDIARDAASRLIQELTATGRRAGTVVDVGCGSGILAQAVTEAGYGVVGIDISDDMLALARRRVPGAEFRKASFVDAAVPASVAVVAVGEVLNYGFDPANRDPGRAAWLRRAYEALRPGGILLFDAATLGRVPPEGSSRTSASGPDWEVLVDTTFEASTGLLLRKITSIRRVGPLCRRDEEIHRLSLMDPAARLATLRAAGFDAGIIQGYGSVSLPPGVVAFLGRKPV